jgi:hypothetical protein
MFFNNGYFDFFIFLLLTDTGELGVKMGKTD